MTLLSATTDAQQDKPAAKVQAKTPDELIQDLERARAPGYRMLLRQLHVPEDEGRFGKFFDHGALAVTDYAGHRDLPAGHWVYVYPTWYIWRDRLPATTNRPYGPEQAAGAPDVKEAGDNQAAWCPQSENPEHEWLLAEFDKPINATAVRIHETFTPGSVERVTLLALDGREIEAWQAEEVGNIADKSRMLSVSVPLGFVVTRIKVDLSPSKAKGWNEIDAIGIVDPKGTVHWAHAVAASSTYAPAQANVPADAPRTGPSPDRPVEIEAASATDTEHELADLRKRVDVLESKLDRILKLLEELREKQELQRGK